MQYDLEIVVPVLHEEGNILKTLKKILEKRVILNVDGHSEILEMEKQLREMSEKLSQNLLVLNKRVQDNSRNIKKISEGN